MAILAAEQGVLPQPLFATNALALGDITADRDADGMLRRAKAFRIYRDWHPLFKQVEADPEYGVDLSQARIQTGKIVLPRLARLVGRGLVLEIGTGPQDPKRRYFRVES